MKSKTDYTEINGEIYLSFTGVLKMILGRLFIPTHRRGKSVQCMQKKTRIYLFITSNTQVL